MTSHLTIEVLLATRNLATSPSPSRPKAPIATGDKPSSQASNIIVAFTSLAPGMPYILSTMAIKKWIVGASTWPSGIV